MSTSRILVVTFLVYGAAFFLGMASIAVQSSIAPFWQAPALVCISAYLWSVAFSIVRGYIGL